MRKAAEGSVGRTDGGEKGVDGTDDTPRAGIVGEEQKHRRFEENGTNVVYDVTNVPNR